MNNKFLLLTLLFFSLVSAQAQISVTAVSGVGQTFINEDANFGSKNIGSFYRRSSITSFSDPSFHHGIMFSYQILPEYKIEAGVEVLRENLINYRMREVSHSTALAKSVGSGHYSSINSGTISLPLSIIYQKPIWREKLFSSLKLGAAYSYNAYLIPPTNHQGSSSYYGASDDDPESFNFFIVRFRNLRRNTIYFNMAASLDWKMSKYWQVSVGGHYRHGFMAFAQGEATYFEDVEINATPEQLNDGRFMSIVASTLYNGYVPTDRHSFTTNGTSLFGTLALTYTFAKKEKKQ